METLHRVMKVVFRREVGSDLPDCVDFSYAKQIFRYIWPNSVLYGFVANGKILIKCILFFSSLLYEMEIQMF